MIMLKREGFYLLPLRKEHNLLLAFSWLESIASYAVCIAAVCYTQSIYRL